MTPNRKTYEFSPEEKRILAGASLLPDCLERTQLLIDLFEDEKIESVGFANIVGALLDVMATVEENTKEIVEMVAIEEMGMHPDKTPAFNMPSILGALNGYELAKKVDQHKLCDGCAFRKGTAANTCLTTIHDAKWQQDNEDIFWCHKDMDDEGKPTKKCIGFMKKKAQSNG